MKIAVSNIPEEGLRLNFSRNGNWLRERLPEAEKDDFCVQDAVFECFIKRIRDTLLLEGHLDTVVETQCSRCLESIQLPVADDFKYTLSPADDRHTEELNLSSDDLDFVYYQDDLIDLDSLVYEQIILHVPMRALCNDSCRGLCPHCGINLNDENCTCAESQADDRFAALKNFKIK